MADKSKEDWKCGKCSLQYDYSDKKEQYWLECDSCDGKYDTICLKISKSQYNTMSRDDILWVCPTCLPVVEQFKKELKKAVDLGRTTCEGIEYLKISTNNILKQQIEIEKAIKAVETQMEKNRETIDGNLKEKIEEVKSSVTTEVPKLWTDVVKNANINNQGPNEVDVVKQVKRAMYEISEANKEEEVRSRGIVVYKLPEGENESREERSSEDKTIINDLLEFLGCNAEVVYAERLGRFNEGRWKEKKYRPIKVRFSNKEERDMVLKSLPKLRNAPECFKSLSIRQDLNEMQRDELRRKMDEAFERTRLSPTKFYRVKGGPGNYNIIELEKKFPFRMASN